MTVRIHRLILAAAVAVALTTVTACGSEDDSGGSDSSGSGGGKASAPKKLVSDGEFTACMDVTFPPMEYYEGSSKEPKGYDVAVIKAVSEAWGVKPVYKDTSFDGLLPALSAGRCDVAWSSMYITPERTKTFAALKYAKSRTAVIVRDGNPDDIKSVDDLSGKTLVAQTATSLLDEAKKIVADYKKAGKTPPKLQQYGKATDLIQQLIVGRADAAMTIDTEAQFRVEQNSGQIEVGFQLPKTQDIGVYFSPDNLDLGETLRKELLALKKDGTLAEIGKKESFPDSAIAIGSVAGP